MFGRPFLFGYFMQTVIHSVNPYLEPTTVWIHDQIRSLRRYNPIVFARSVRNEDRFPVSRLIDFTAHGALLGVTDRVWIRMSGMYPRYGSYVTREGGDVIHAHFGQEGFRCLAARRKANIPLVTTFYGLDVSALPKIPMWRRRFERLFREGDLFLAEGPFMAECLAELGCPKRKIQVQRLGIDLERFNYRPPSKRETTEVLMYASLREKKGHRFGIEAFARVLKTHDDLRLTIAGDGPLKSDLVQQVNQLGIRERVDFLGMVTHEEGRELLDRATVLVSPSLTASDGDTEGGAPVTLLEAMASGLPIVSTRHADIPYVLKGGEAGLLVEENDTDGLARGLSSLLDTSERREALAEAGRSAVVERHALATQAESLEAHYDSVIYSYRERDSPPE